MRALYFFIRKLAAVEPHNPARKTPVLQNQADRMTTMWVSDPDSFEFKQGKRIADKYKLDMIEAEGEPDMIKKVDERFAAHFESYLQYFINPGAAAAMRNVMRQLLWTDDTELIHRKMTLSKLVLHERLTDIFVHLVNARINTPSDPTSFRGLSDRSSATLNDTYQRYLNDLVNARCIMRDDKELWVI